MTFETWYEVWKRTPDDRKGVKEVVREIWETAFAAGKASTVPPKPPDAELVGFHLVMALLSEPAILKQVIEQGKLTLERVRKNAVESCAKEIDDCGYALAAKRLREIV